MSTTTSTAAATCTHPYLAEDPKTGLCVDRCATCGAEGVAKSGPGAIADVVVDRLRAMEGDLPGVDIAADDRAIRAAVARFFLPADMAEAVTALVPERLYQARYAA